MMTANDDVEEPSDFEKIRAEFHGNSYYHFELIILMCLAIALEVL
ncbi:hypothetical protein CSB74_2817 [Staphylococcus aureus]|nr:hypothetical protein CSB74_2817 [Staphylococcus aureus]